MISREKIIKSVTNDKIKNQTTEHKKIKRNQTTEHNINKILENYNIKFWDRSQKPKIEDIIWLASFPRSGNTMTRLMLLHYYGHHSNSIYGKEFSNYNLGHENAIFCKTHKVNRRNDINKKVILIIRDPRSVATSWYYYKFRKVDYDEWFSGIYLKRFCDNWNKFNKSWIKCKNVQIIKYEDLANNYKILQPALRHFNVPLAMPNEEMPSFDKLHQNLPKFFRRGSSNWKDELPKKYAESIEHRCSELIHKYKFNESDL